MSKSSDQARQEINPSGSPQSGEPVYLTIGKFCRTHGVKGEIVLEMTTDFPERIQAGTRIYIGKDKQSHTLTAIRPHGRLFLIYIAGYDDCDAVSVFRNQTVYVDASIIGPLPEGRFYHREVIGMQVEDEQGKLIGRVKEILVTGANDVYVIETPNDSEILIPAINQVVLSMNRETQKMIVKLQEWD